MIVTPQHVRQPAKKLMTANLQTSWVGLGSRSRCQTRTGPVSVAGPAPTDSRRERGSCKSVDLALGWRQPRS
jgi:hypothetical protein